MSSSIAHIISLRWNLSTEPGTHQFGSTVGLVSFEELSVSPHTAQNWRYRYFTVPGFQWGLGIPTLGLMLAQQALHPLSPLPSLSSVI